MTAVSVEKLFAKLANELIGLKLSHIWQGHGSAIFLEFGPLKDRLRTDGSPGNPSGEFNIMIEWNWRIEKSNQVLCGAWCDEQEWPSAFGKLIGLKVKAISLFGRLPEISVSLADEYHVLSFMNSKGDPEWALFDNRNQDRNWISVRNGSLVVDA
ncbi:MAG: hypothetical protein HKN36_05240 [Hellea sp.]|nr:hypothetical protein [Hellea sp.]